MDIKNILFLTILITTTYGKCLTKLITWSLACVLTYLLDVNLKITT